ncbi:MULTISPECIES: S8 family peptidase [Pseudomonas]|uniref:S8/S53 family peptidase n=1 Tax=Pseudomonas quercus TaxID=2722792 RepID=A0ABX0YAW4_9PSED|nr:MULTISPECIES: S8/S53 family peptidase [Pseudomonas]MBF7140861.1 S8/S53 family peptidase [Pseudomonas sp. LY10J]NJO99395.1 S8/S53 family peptidase [Pseudomonas quercus]
MERRWLVVLLVWGLATGARAEPPLRLETLERCADLLDTRRQVFCLKADGLGPGPVKTWLGAVEKANEREGNHLRLTLETGKDPSGPLLLEQEGRASNSVWLSMAGNHVLAAKPNETAVNAEGLTTYLNLVSVVIEERYNGLEQVRKLAQQYGATLVGAIPALNTWQLRLPVNTLTERDALILRLGHEVSVDAVVIEESSAEEAEREVPPPGQVQEEWAANRFVDAVNYYRRRIAARGSPIDTAPVRIGVIERNVDFDSEDFAEYVGPCQSPRLCVYARDARSPKAHGSSVTGVLAAHWLKAGNTGFLRGLEGVSRGFEIIVERDSDAGITANVAASVNLVEDGARVLNWSWGLHRVGAQKVQGGDIDTQVRSGVAMAGYEELLEEFFRWLKAKHPNVVVINSAGNGASYAGQDDYRLPSSFVTDQLLVVGGHERSEASAAPLGSADYAVRRGSSNLDSRVDISAAACAPGVDPQVTTHCGTSFATPLVTGTVAAMLSINPQLTPAQLRLLLRRSAMPIGADGDFEPADGEDLTAPILPSERNFDLNHPDVGRSARLDMQKALELTVQSRDRRR